MKTIVHMAQPGEFFNQKGWFAGLRHVKFHHIFWALLLALAWQNPLAHAQVLNEYRSNGNGNWNEISTWQRFNGATFVNATAVPTAFNSAKVRIQPTDTVTITVSASGESVIVEPGGKLIANASLSLSQFNSSFGLVVNGEMVLNGSSNISGAFGSATIQVNDLFTINSGSLSVNVEVTFNGGVIKQSSGTLDINSFFTFSNRGIFLWNAGGISFSAVTFRNRDTGEFYMNGGFFFSGVPGSSEFFNDGLVVSTSTGSGGLGIPFTNNSTGILRGNSFFSTSTGISNSGEIRPGINDNTIGRLRFLSTPTLPAASKIFIKMLNGGGPGTGHDQVVFHTNTTLNGTITVTEMAGASIPDGSYTIVRTNDLSKTLNLDFTTYNVPAGYTVVKDDTTVKLIKGSQALNYVFTGNGLWSTPTNWQNNTVPPASLPAGSTITINGTGPCNLDVNQTIQLDATMTVNPSKTFVVPVSNTFSLSGKLVNNGTTNWNASGIINITTAGAESISGTGVLNMTADETLFQTVIRLSGNGTFNATARRRARVALAEIEVENGNLSITANPLDTAVFDIGGAILINAGTLRTKGTGNIILNGKGLIHASVAQHGVVISGNSLVESQLATGGGRIEMTGKGGAGTGANVGVFVNQSIIKTNSGNILINGSSIGIGNQNIGIVVQNSGKVESFGSGQLLLNGTGSANGDSFNYGIFTAGSANLTSTGSGLMSLNGSGFGSLDQNIGVLLNSAVGTGGTAKMKIRGNGSTEPESTNSIGVLVSSSGFVTSNSDSLIIIGNGSGGSNGHGVMVTSGVISASDQSKLLVMGNGSPQGFLFNYGVFVTGSFSNISSTGCPLTILAQGGGTENDNPGLRLEINASVSTSNSGGKIKIFANGSPTGIDNCSGIQLVNNSKIESSGDSVIIQAFGKGTGNLNTGISIGNNCGIISTSGAVRIDGNGSPTGQFSHGVHISTPGSNITATNSNLLVNGIAGGTGNSNTGIFVSAGKIDGNGLSKVDVFGTGGGSGAAGTANHGIFISDLGRIKAGDLACTITGTAGAGNSPGIKLSETTFGSFNHGSFTTLLTVTGIGSGTGNDIETVGASNKIGSSSSRNVTVVANTYEGEKIIGNTIIVKPRSASTTIGLGDGIGTLQLSNAELTNIEFGNFGALTIGDNSAGTGQLQIKNATLVRSLTAVGGSIKVSGLDCGSKVANLRARTGNISDFDDSGADISNPFVLNLEFPNGALSPGNSPGIFAITGNYTHNGKLDIEIGGANPGTGFDQLNVSGTLGIDAGSTLQASIINGFTPTPGQTFDVAVGSSLTGTFQTENLPSGWTATYLSDRVRLTAPAGGAFNPTISAGGPTTFCAGGSVLLSATTGTGFSHKWFRNNIEIGGQTSATLTATQSGTYKAEVTNNLSQTATTNEIVVTVNPTPATPTISAGGPTTFCAGGSVQLTSSSASGNLWSNGATTQSITVSSSGNFTVQVIALGCSSAVSNSVSVTVNPTPATPSISAGGPTTFCAGGSVQLTSNAATGNLWSNGATSQSITVSSSGNFTVQVIALGCSSAVSNSVSVTVNPTPATPSISAGGPTTFCAGGSVQLTSNAATGNLWSNGATTQSITVSSSGNFTVQVIALGCSSAVSNSVGVTVNPLPVVNAGPDVSIEVGQSANLVATGAATYQWSPIVAMTPPNGVGAAVTVNPDQTTLYTVTGTNANNCSASDAVLVTVTGGSGPLTAPMISPATGTYSGPQMVTITSTSPGAEIYYTTSGNLPVVGTGFTKLYTGPFQVLQTTTVRAMAVKEGQANSSVAVSFLTITNPGICAAPVVSPASGSYEGSVTVSMSTSTPEAEIWYTTNGNNPRFDVPNTFTKKYTAPFILYGNTPIKAIAIKAGLVNSPIVSVNYTITNPAIVATPTFSPLPGNFGSAQSITLSTTTADAQIYYTTNGNVPRIDVPNSFTKLYTGPFLLSQSATVRAKAFKAGWLESSTAVGIYTFGGARSAVAAVESEENLEKINVFPNPSASGLFNVLLPASEGESVNYTVLAMDGKEIQAGTLTSGQNQSLDLRSFPSGLYQLKIQSERRMQVVRLVKE